jgi:hypothetical protein
MNLNPLTIAGPYTHENLTIFLLRGSDTLDGARFLPLDEALEQNCVTVHETGTVGQLEVENLSECFDLYIQAGDIVKGGRQDRTLGVDFVLPAKSGRVPIPSFCVESGRWRRRAGENAEKFSSSKFSLSSKSLRMAMKLSKNQGEVWQKVAEAQEDLSASLGKPLYAKASPSSFQLTVEDEDLQKRKGTYRTALAKIIDETPDALGYAFVINGELNTADTYGSGLLFRKLWSKLLDTAILEAIAEARRNPAAPAATTAPGTLTSATDTTPDTAPAAGAASAPVTPETIQRWLVEAGKTAISDCQEVPPRVRVETRRGEKTIVFDTRDHAFNDAVLHQNLVAN